MFNSKLTTLILIAFCTIMGNLIYYLFNQADETAKFDPNHQTKNIDLEKTDVSQARSLGEISNYEDIILRPLFSNTRQVEPESKTEDSKKVAPVKTLARNPHFSLIGIVINGEEKMALIKGRRDPKPTQVKIDEEINGWTLVEVKANSAELESSGQTITLEITRKADPKQTQKRLNAQAQAKQQNKLQTNNKVNSKALNNTRSPNQSGNQTKPAQQADFDIRDTNDQNKHSHLPNEFDDD